MTSAHSAAVRHLRVVDEAVRARRPAPPLVGYLVLVPEGSDPTEMFAADGMRAEFRPLPSTDPADSGARTGLHIDPQRRTAEADGQPLGLTYLEFELLAHFVAHPHRVHTRDHLVATLWGYSHIGDGRTVDVHIARLRRKSGPSRRGRIVTVRRVGYKYEPDRTG